MSMWTFEVIDIVIDAIVHMKVKDQGGAEWESVTYAAELDQYRYLGTLSSSILSTFARHWSAD